MGARAAAWMHHCSSAQPPAPLPLPLDRPPPLPLLPLSHCCRSPTAAAPPLLPLSHCCRSYCRHPVIAATPPLLPLPHCRHPLIAATPPLPPPDFTYSQVSFAGSPISWPGRTHEGFSKLAAHLWLTGVQAAADDLVLAQGSSIQHVVVTGHSMGAGVSTLLSYTIRVGVCSVTDRGSRGTSLHARVFGQGCSRLKVLHRAAVGS